MFKLAMMNIVKARNEYSEGKQFSICSLLSKVRQNHLCLYNCIILASILSDLTINPPLLNLDRRNKHSFYHIKSIEQASSKSKINFILPFPVENSVYPCDSN